MPVVLGLLGVIPGIVKAAESIFGGSKGADKKDYVLAAVGILYDRAIGKVMPDIPRFDERRWFMKVADVTIEEVVAAMKEEAK